MKKRDLIRYLRNKKACKRAINWVTNSKLPPGKLYAACRQEWHDWLLVEVYGGFGCDTDIRMSEAYSEIELAEWEKSRNPKTALDSASAKFKKWMLKNYPWKRVSKRIEKQLKKMKKEE